MYFATASAFGTHTLVEPITPTEPAMHRLRENFHNKMPAWLRHFVQLPGWIPMQEKLRMTSSSVSESARASAHACTIPAFWFFLFGGQLLVHRLQLLPLLMPTMATLKVKNMHNDALQASVLW